MRKFVVIIVLLIGILLIINNAAEHFGECNVPLHNCDCSLLGRQECNNCSNCGFCMTSNGVGTCVHGDALKPTVKENCMAYEHMNTQFRCNLNPFVTYFSYDYAPEWYDVHKPMLTHYPDEDEPKSSQTKMIHKLANARS